VTFTVLPVEFVDLENMDLALFTGEARVRDELKSTLLDSLGELSRHLNEAMEEEEIRNRLIVVSIIGGMVGLCTGLITRALGVGSLFTGLYVSVAPMWRCFDPLLILGGRRSEDEAQRNAKGNFRQPDVALLLEQKSFPEKGKSSWKK
jgi:hypothetical protein